MFAKLAGGMAAFLLVAYCAGSAVGQQSSVDQTLEGSISPKRVGTPNQPRPATLTVTTTGDTIPPGGQPPTLTRAVILFPRGATANGRLFTSCQPATLQQRGPSGCPRSSRLGSGRAEGKVGDLVVPAEVDVFNGPRGRSVLFWIEARQPVSIRAAVVAPLRRLRGGRYGYRLTFPVPDNIQQPVPGLETGVTLFRVKVGATRMVRGRRRGYIETHACPRSGRAPLRGTFSYRAHADVTVDNTIACSR
jgi:hypothetical protein